MWYDFRLFNLKKMLTCLLYRWTGGDHHVSTLPAGPPHDGQRAGCVEWGGCHGILHLWLLNWGLFTLPVQVSECVFVLCDKAMVKSTVTSFSAISRFATNVTEMGLEDFVFWKSSYTFLKASSAPSSFISCSPPPSFCERNTAPPSSQCFLTISLHPSQPQAWEKEIWRVCSREIEKERC